MTKIRNSKPVLVIEYWNLRFVCNLVLGICDFISSSHSTSSFCMVISPAKPAKLAKRNVNGVLDYWEAG